VADTVAGVWEVSGVVLDVWLENDKVGGLV
jgi:hypothetical protein